MNGVMRKSAGSPRSRIDALAVVDLVGERQRRAEMRVDAARALRLARRDAQQPAVVEELALRLQRVEAGFLDPPRIERGHRSSSRASSGHALPRARTRAACSRPRAGRRASRRCRSSSRASSWRIGGGFTMSKKRNSRNATAMPQPARRRRRTAPAGTRRPRRQTIAPWSGTPRSRPVDPRRPGADQQDRATMAAMNTASLRVTRSSQRDRDRHQRAERARRERREAGAEAQRDEMRRMTEQERERRRAARFMRVGSEMVEGARQRRQRRAVLVVDDEPRTSTVIAPMRVSGSASSRAIAAMRARAAGGAVKHELVVVAAGKQAVERERAFGSRRASPRARANAESRRARSIAPTCERARMWPRSPVSPSETSIAADATPRSASPSATRGSGRSSRARAAASASAASDVRPSIDRDARAPRRRAIPKHRRRLPPARRRGAAPCRPGLHRAIVTHSVRGPRVVSPPTSIDAVRVREREKAARERLEPAAVASGSAPASSAQRGRRAHRRDVGEIHRERLVPERLGIGAGEEMPALDQHVDRQRRARSPASARATPRRRRRPARPTAIAAAARRSARSARIRSRRGL